MKLPEYFRHFQLTGALPQYADRQLPEALREKITIHLSECGKCRRRLTGIREMREVIKRSNPVHEPDAGVLWSSIQAGIEESAMPSAIDFKSYLRPRHKYSPVWGLAMAVVIFGVLLVWRGWLLSPSQTLPPLEITHSAAVFDFGLFIDSQTQHQNADAFYQRYNAVLVDPRDLSVCSFIEPGKINAIQNACQMGCARLLRNEQGECAEIVFALNGKPVSLFQQMSGQSWTFGRHALTRDTIAGIECLVVNGEDICLVSWQGGNTEYLIAGDLSRDEIASVIKLLK